MNRPPLLITSLKNDQVKDLVRLRNRRDRERSGLIIIEEPLVLRHALKSGHPMQTVYFCPERLDDQDQALLVDLLAATDEAIELSAPVMDKVAYRDKSDGLLVVAPPQSTSLEDLDLGSQPLMMVLESVEKPGNLGAALRVADGAGADALIICGEGTDLFNPNVLRASRGAFFSMPTVACTRQEMVEFLREKGVKLLAATPAADQSWDEVDFRQPVAVVLGTEHEGLSAELMDLCDLKVSLPMLGVTDSLNVSTSAAVLLYEAVRQRRLKTGEQQ